MLQVFKVLNLFLFLLGCFTDLAVLPWHSKEHPGPTWMLPVGGTQSWFAEYHSEASPLFKLPRLWLPSGQLLLMPGCCCHHYSITQTVSKKLASACLWLADFQNAEPWKPCMLEASNLSLLEISASDSQHACFCKFCAWKLLRVL